MDNSYINEELKVIKNIKDFLENLDNVEIMEEYYSKLQQDGNRIFENRIPEESNDTFDSKFKNVSIVVLTANQFECDMLNYLASKHENSHLVKRKQALQIMGNNFHYAPRAYVFSINNYCILHLKAYDTGSYTPGGSADLARYISENKLLKPSCIVSFGICYGRNPDEQKIGDVIIPEKLYPWSIGLKVTDNDIYVKHDNFNLLLSEKFSSDPLYSEIENYCSNTKTIKKEVIINNQDKITKYDLGVQLTYGNISTGEAVISSKIAKEEIPKINGNEKEIGGEMEGYGLAKECIYQSSIPCLIVKAICDWGEIKNIEEGLAEYVDSNTGSMIFTDNVKKYTNKNNCLKDKLQVYAALCAGFVFFDILEKRLFTNKSFQNEISVQIERQLNNFNMGVSISYTDLESSLKKIISDMNLPFSPKQVISMLLEEKLIETSDNEHFYKTGVN